MREKTVRMAVVGVGAIVQINHIPGTCWLASFEGGGMGVFVDTLPL